MNGIFTFHLPEELRSASEVKTEIMSLDTRGPYRYHPEVVPREACAKEIAATISHCQKPMTESEITVLVGNQLGLHNSETHISSPTPPAVMFVDVPGKNYDKDGMKLSWQEDDIISASHATHLVPTTGECMVYRKSEGWEVVGSLIVKPDNKDGEIRLCLRTRHNNTAVPYQPVETMGLECDLSLLLKLTPLVEPSVKKD
jgi:hypothetical protein